MDNGSSSYDRYLAGDDAALGEIIHEYRDGLIAFLNGFTNDIFEAEELVVETFFRLAYKKPEFSGKCSFRTWIYQIARNLAIDNYRKKKNVHFVSTDECYDISDSVDIEEDYLKEERKKIIHRLIGKLKYEYRQVIWLIYIEGFSNSETALIMHKNSRQITNLLYQAKKALRKELEKEGITYAGL